MAEALLEILIGSVVGRFLGLNTRYFILKIFNKKLKKKDLVNKENDINGLQQDTYNGVIGLIVFVILLIGITYPLYLLGLI